MIFPKYGEGGRGGLFDSKNPSITKPRIGPMKETLQKENPPCSPLRLHTPRPSDLHSHGQHQGRIETAGAQGLSHAADAFRGGASVFV